MKVRDFGYDDDRVVSKRGWDRKKYIGLILAIIFILACWLFLDAKLLFGDEWLSPTYDNDDWRANEGNLHTFGAWDLETHIWKSQFIVENFPNYDWNPYWYLGMPLLKYYQSAFYFLHIGFSYVIGVSLPKGALLLLIFSHLAAVLVTFLLAYKISGKILVSALSSLFLLSSSFVSLRSYGWEPITVVFLFLYPLTLLFFLREPLRPFRFSLIILMGLSYLCHPLLFFSSAMSMGLYLFSIAIRDNKIKNGKRNYIWGYFGMIFTSLLIGAVQFLPQITYYQESSGAHMGVKYIPFYHVPYNVINVFDFFFDAGNLKGPGLIIMISVFLIFLLGVINMNSKVTRARRKTILGNELVAGFVLILGAMILFYYMEAYNIFPMNIFRSIQYHRIIPEFIVAGIVLIAGLSNILDSQLKKILYYSVLISFALVSLIVIYNTQIKWETTNDISGAQEFVYENVNGRITFPYSDQSFSVRNSFTKKHQVYGYYEQGVINPYNDELFSVSSGFHDPEVSLIYLKAGNVGRIYVNEEEGERDKIVKEMFQGILNYTYVDGARYGYFSIPLKDYSYAQAIEYSDFLELQNYDPGCRTLFKERYCGSSQEEFVLADKEEINYLIKYLDILDINNTSDAEIEMIDPDHYRIRFRNAKSSTGAVIKMSYDKDFSATLDGKEIEIEKAGPSFMAIFPEKDGSYEVLLEYKTSKIIKAGLIISILSFMAVCIGFIFGLPFDLSRIFKFQGGDL